MRQQRRQVTELWTSKLNTKETSKPDDVYPAAVNSRDPDAQKVSELPKTPLTRPPPEPPPAAKNETADSDFGIKTRARLYLRPDHGLRLPAHL